MVLITLAQLKLCIILTTRCVQHLKTWAIKGSYEGMIDHHSYLHNLSSCAIKAWQNVRLERTHDLCDTGAVLYQLSYQVWSHSQSDFSCVHNCSDQSCLHIFVCSSNIWSFIYSLVKRKLSGKRQFALLILVIDFYVFFVSSVILTS